MNRSSRGFADKPKAVPSLRPPAAQRADRRGRAGGRGEVDWARRLQRARRLGAPLPGLVRREEADGDRTGRPGRLKPELPRPNITLGPPEGVVQGYFEATAEALMLAQESRTTEKGTSFLDPKNSKSRAPAQAPRLEVRLRDDNG